MSDPTYHAELEQGSDEWLAARCGMLTASNVKLIMTPTGKPANNDKCRAHAYELAAQRLNQYVEPQYVGADMLRGEHDEIVARDLYGEHYMPVLEMGFITRDFDGMTIGYSPDGLAIGLPGAIEIKSRCQKHQMRTIATDEVPAEYLLQIHTGILVAGLLWVDFVSYCGGMPMYVKRVARDEEWIAKILEAATAFEASVRSICADYSMVVSNSGLVDTERHIEQEMVI